MIDTLQNDLKDSMRARDKARTSTLRMLISAFKNATIDKGGDLSDDETVELLAREAKRRREAAVAFRDGERHDLADKEEAELALIESYLPQQLSEDEVRAIAREVIAAVNPSSARDMGRVMGQAMPQLKGRFDGKAASAVIRDEFNKAIA